jgi:hypothetical protein
MLHTLSRGELWERAKQTHALGDFSSADRYLDQMLLRNPSDLDARGLKDKNLGQLERKHLARLRSLEATPRIAVGYEQLVWQNLDARKGFLLSRVDGTMSVQDIIDIVHFPRQETIRLLAELVDEGILVCS